MAGTKLTVKTPNLGHRIAVARDALRLTQAELGKALGIDSNNVSRYEKGKVTPPAKAYPVLVRVLQRPREYFVDEPLGDEPPATVTERDDSVAGLPNLKALMMSGDWNAATPEARALVLDEVNRSGGDLSLEEWVYELKRAKRRHPSEAREPTKNAAGRVVGEQDEYEGD